MVARIKQSQSLSNAVNYNEQKVHQEKAQCIAAVNYAKDVEQLNFYQKLHRLKHQACLNERVKTNSVHISLNFDATDKLNKEKLEEIANSYMEKIGFGNQPYLVYEHTDAGHQHIHIVTTNIEEDGHRIDMHNIGRNQSEEARKQIELEYKLVQAQSKKQQQSEELRPVNAQRVMYRKSETKRAITNVLDEVLPHYKYTSLPELNAVLKLYNVLADRGPEASKMYQSKGLVYRVLDEQGNKVGTPIKASAFYNKPTLPSLEQKFKENQALRQQFKSRVKTKIDWTILVGAKSLAGFVDKLRTERIDVLVRQNAEGKIYGMTYVDHANQTVFNSSDIGKEYTAKSILERIEANEQKHTVELSQNREITFDIKVGKGVADEIKKFVKDTWVDLTRSIDQEAYVPKELMQKKKKKKKRSTGMRL
jgi:hypothetical protein